MHTTQTPDGPVVDLKALAAGRYKMRLDESATVDRCRANRPWYCQIVCKNGHIYPHGAATLAAYSGGYYTAAKLARLSFAKVHQRGEGEVTITFAPEHFDAVAEIMLPRRKRKLSEGQRQAKREQMIAYNACQIFPVPRALNQT